MTGDIGLISGSASNSFGAFRVELCLHSTDSSRSVITGGICRCQVSPPKSKKASPAIALNSARCFKKRQTVRCRHHQAALELRNPWHLLVRWRAAKLGAQFRCDGLDESDTFDFTVLFTENIRVYFNQLET